MDRGKISTGRTIQSIVLILSLSLITKTVVSAKKLMAAPQQAMSSPANVDLEMRNQELSHKALSKLMGELEERERKIAEKEMEITNSRKKLNLDLAKFDELRNATKKAEDELRATIAMADSAAENDVENLTIIYQNMKPKLAADLFSHMDSHFAAGFIGRMKPDNAAAILETMDVQAAYAVSAILAGRNAHVETSDQADGLRE